MHTFCRRFCKAILTSDILLPYRNIKGTSMACPHVTGFIAALLTKKLGKSYCNEVKGDESLRKLLNANFVRDIGTKGRDNATGLGFISYLDKEEFDDVFKKH